MINSTLSLLHNVHWAEAEYAPQTTIGNTPTKKGEFNLQSHSIVQRQRRKPGKKEPSRLARHSKTLSPKSKSVSESPGINHRTGKLSNKRPQHFHPHGNQSPDDKLGRLVTGDRKFQKLHFRIEAALSRAWRERLNAVTLHSAILFESQMTHTKCR